jgi:hypothetical protein
MDKTGNERGGVSFFRYCTVSGSLLNLIWYNYVVGRRSLYSQHLCILEEKGESDW